MQAFISEITSFIWNLIYFIRGSIVGFTNLNTSISNSIGLSSSSYETFLDKPLISGDLINITVTFRELLLYFIPIFLIGLTIYLFIKFIVKILGIFKFN